MGDYVVARNSTAIDFYWAHSGVGLCPSGGAACLVNRPFSLSYEDTFGDSWIVDISAGTWAP